MKVENNGVYQENPYRISRENGITGTAKKAKSISAGNLAQNLDPIAMKKKSAQERAMKVVGEAFANDKKVDQQIEERRAMAREASQEKAIFEERLKHVEEAKARVKEKYGITDDSQEQKDMELLQKRSNFMELTEEEKEHLAELDERGLTDYQKESMSLDASSKACKQKINELAGAVASHYAMVKNMQEERRKSHPMVDAVEEAEQIKEQASEQIVDMLVDEGKEHIDEVKEEQEEKAKEKETEEKKQEKLEAAIEEKIEEMQAMADPDKKVEHKEEEPDSEVMTQELVKQEQGMGEVQAEVDNIVSKMKLIKEDIKGAVVDTQL